MQLNELNSVDRQLLEMGKKLPVMEEFYTIQGEGANTGKPAYFIRVGGCDVCCHWCDVKESWNPELHPLKEVDSVVNEALLFPANDIVITGGEPTLYNLSYLCEQFQKKGKHVFLETSGAYPLTGKWHWICLSPKKTAPPLPDIYAKANELKVIVFNTSDFLWAEEHAAKMPLGSRLFLQPEWSKCKEMLPAIINYVQLNPKWNISLQSHKFMGIP